MSREIVQAAHNIGRKLGHLGAVSTDENELADVYSVRELSAIWTLGAFRAYRACENATRGIEGWPQISSVEAEERFGLTKPHPGIISGGVFHTTASGRMSVIAWDGMKDRSRLGAIDIIISAGSDPLPKLMNVKEAYNLLEAVVPSIDGVTVNGDGVWCLAPDATSRLHALTEEGYDEVYPVFEAAQPATVVAVRYIPYGDGEWEVDVLQCTPHLLLNRPDRVALLRWLDTECFGGVLAEVALEEARERASYRTISKWDYSARWIGYAFQEFDRVRQAAESNS